MSMRIVLIGVVAALAVAAVSMEPADAKRRGGPPPGPPPWCNQGNSVNGGMMECSYYTLQQCLVSARGVGGGCVTNPWYEWQERYRQGWRY
jgi:hypothetical protein